VLTQWTAHLDRLVAELSQRGHEPVVLRGGMGAKSRAAALARLVPQTDGPPLLVVATEPLGCAASGSHHAEAVEPLDERDLAALLATKLLEPVGKRLARSLAAADLSQFIEQSRRRVVVGHRASLDELNDLTPGLVLPSREFPQVVLAGAFSGATALSARR